MLDHVLVETISAVRRSLEAALLQRQAVEERFQVDVFLGDVSWETSYSLPGEEQPPRVRADISLDWPTWSQTAYRSWSIGETPDEMPEVVLEIALRIQRLAEEPPVSLARSALPESSPPLGDDGLVRSSVTIEQVHNDTDGGGDAGAGAGAGGGERSRAAAGGTAGSAGPGRAEPTDSVARWAVEGTYEGSIRFDERHLEDPSSVVPMIDTLTRWLASTLIRLADLQLRFVPPDPADD